MDIDAFLVVLIQAKFVEQKDWLMWCQHSPACLQLCVMQQRTVSSDGKLFMRRFRCLQVVKSI